MAAITDNSSSGIIANAPNLYKLMTGEYDNSTTLTGFNIPPHLEFLHGNSGYFNFQKLYTSYPANESVTKYPYAAVGILYLTNPTDEPITEMLPFEGSADNSTYGAAVLTAPLSVNPLVWTPLYQLSLAHPNFGIDLEVTVPAIETLALMMITTSAALATSPLTSQFLSLKFSGIRKLLAKGIKIDTYLTVRNSQKGGN
jgi:hypothetical protein